MVKHLLLSVALGLGASVQALGAGQEIRSLEATSPTYVFGDAMRLNESLDMVEYGPMRSSITKCANAVAFCWASDAVTILAPKSCNYFGTKSTLVADGYVIRKIGLVKYSGFFEKSKATMDALLLRVDGRDDEVIGYSPRLGVLFVISDARPRSRLVTDLKKAAKNRSLQDAFNTRSASLLKLRGPDKLFTCEK